MITDSDELPNPALYVVGMIGAPFIGLLFGPTAWVRLVVALGASLFAYWLGWALFRQTWREDCGNVTRVTSGIWLIGYGLAGIYMALGLGYANLGPASREGYAIIRTTLDGEIFIWFFGGILLVVLGIALVGRCIVAKTRS